MVVLRTHTTDMRYALFSFCLLLVITVNCTSQTMQGMVTDATTYKPLFPVTVVNINTQQAAYTDVNGFYVIPARPGDKIAFSYVGYKTVEKLKPVSVLIATQNITMQRREYELDEVFLRPDKLTQYQKDSIERRQIYHFALDREPPSPVMSPVSALAEKLSGKAKRIYRFQGEFAWWEKQKFIDNRYTADVIRSVTDMRDDSTISAFMAAFPMPYDYARAATNLEMKMWIRDNYKAWMPHRADSVSTGK